MIMTKKLISFTGIIILSLIQTIAFADERGFHPPAFIAPNFEFTHCSPAGATDHPKDFVVVAKGSLTLLRCAALVAGNNNALQMVWKQLPPDANSSTPSCWAGNYAGSIPKGDSKDCTLPKIGNYMAVAYTRSNTKLHAAPHS